MNSFKFLIFIVSIFLISEVSLASKEKTFLGVEIICSQELKNLELEDLCGKKKNCPWKVVQKSETAKGWERKGEVRVTEVRRKGALKVFLYQPDKFFEMKVPWCPSIGKLRLPQEIRKVSTLLSKESEVVYVLSPKDTIHLPRLKSIKHPCRKLKKVEAKKAYSFYYLMPQPLKGCKTK
jgi:hypothetical protein